VSVESDSSVLRSHRHVVQFYDSDEELTQSAGDYLADAIAEGGAAVIAATPAHCADFEALLTARGVDVAAARREGTLVSLDAAGLARRLGAGRVDRVAFDTQIRPAILAAGQAPGPVRVYGEIVALLWAAGHVNAALELEGFWNELGREIPFSLYCGYPRQSVEGSQHHGAVSEVCRLHTAVAGRPLARAPWGDATRTFRGTREDTRAARGFVLGMLGPWRGEQLAADAALVVTELATNAVLHARSAFSVSLALSRNVIRISVGDTVPLGQPGGDGWPHAEPGHGLGVVAAIAARWGFERLDSGKAVWAELPLPG
jgi:hypothetical protein